MIFSRIHWQSPHLFWAAALALIVAVVSVIWLYRPQLKPLALRWSYAMLALRILALGTLAVSILKPALMIPLKREDRDIMAILVDQSRSMTIRDEARPPAELVHIASALHLLPENSRPDNLEQLRQKIVALQHLATELTLAQSEERYARLSGRGMESAVAHRRDAETAFRSAARSAAETAPALLLAQILEMASQPVPDIDAVLSRIDSAQSEADEQLYYSNFAVQSVCDEVAALNRIELVHRALEGDEGLFALLSLNRQVRVFGFGDSLAPIGLSRVAMDADALHTDLARALAELRQQLSAQRLGAILVFSDGRQVLNESSGPSAAVRNDVPVFVVPVAAPIVKDLSIARVTLPSSAYVGESIVVRVDVSAVGCDGESAEVILEGAGQRQTRSAVIAGELAHFEINFTVSRSGPLELAISVAAKPGEVTTANNSVRRMLKCVSDRLRVALIGGIATRDFQQLRSSLSHAQGFNVVDQLVDATHPCDFSPQVLSEQDIVVLSDVPVAALSQRQWDALSRLVNEDGGSVLMIAGDPSVLGGYGANPLAGSLLPWRGSDLLPAWRVWPGEEPQFRIVPADPDVLDALRLSSDPEVNRQRWNQLPPVFRFVAMPPLKAGARPLLIDRDSGAAVMSETRIGAGRSLLLGMSEIWRWRSALGRRDEDRFWMQILSYAAREPYAAGDGTLWLDVDRLRIEPGETLRIRARVNRSRLGQDAADPTSAPLLRLVRNGVAYRDRELSLVPRSPGQFDATIPDLPVGNYDIQFSQGGRTVATSVEVAESDEAELRDVAGDPQALARLAGAQGEVLPLPEVATLPQRLPRSGNNEPLFAELTLWDSHYLFLFVLGCLGLEWAARKHLGLA